jgi:hypothetical protein
MTQEVRAARDILAEISKIKMDLGLKDRHLGTLDIDAQVTADVTARYPPAITKIVENPESRRKLLGIAERFVSLTEGSTIARDVEMEEDIAEAEAVAAAENSPEYVERPLDEVVAPSFPESVSSSTTEDSE